MPPSRLIDALYQLAKTFGQWHDDGELLSEFVEAFAGENILQRSSNDVCRLVGSKPVKAALAERGVTITVQNGFITLIHCEVEHA